MSGLENNSEKKSDVRSASQSAEAGATLKAHAEVQDHLAASRGLAGAASSNAMPAELNFGSPYEKRNVEGSSQKGFPGSKADLPADMNTPSAKLFKPGESGGADVIQNGSSIGSGAKDGSSDVHQQYSQRNPSENPFPPTADGGNDVIQNGHSTGPGKVEGHQVGHHRNDGSNWHAIYHPERAAKGASQEVGVPPVSSDVHQQYSQRNPSEKPLPPAADGGSDARQSGPSNGLGKVEGH